MNLEHVALTITDHKEIKNFYQEFLGMSEVRNFVLDKDLAREIFGFEKETTVFHLQKDELLLEIFITPEQCEHGFNHLCISIPNREKIVKKAVHHGYECIRVKRQNSDLIFVKDKSGNIFEIKQSS